MAAITAALSFLFATVALSSAEPVEARIDYTPATRSSR
jgi:hypothetical protein